ncbi:MAG: carbamoyltransferase [Rhodothermia bacterium]|nr:MAG: carbamoyltransferase [Rhodothermia bacterium]
MTSYILGISAFYHDSAACLLRDGEIIAAAQEERFSRKKHDHRFPTQAIEYCLSEAGVSSENLTHVAFYDKPWLKFERLLETYLMYAPAGFPSFLRSMPLWLKEKLWMGETIKKEIDFSDELFFPEHHQSHAASAFFPSPFERAAILTIDGVGEWATATWGTGSDNKIDLQFELRFPHSLGLLYSTFTYYTGFRVNSGEYKLMGLAPYGEPRYVQTILDNLIDLKDDGSFRMNMKYFNYCQGLTMTSPAFHELFGGPPREPESRITQREMDLARSVQVVSEEIILRMAQHVQKETSEKNLCLAGGVALNCVANGRILEERIFENIWIQPAAGDAGGALGAAMFVWHQVLENSRTPSAAAQKGSYLGPAFRSETISRWLDRNNIPYSRVNNEKERYSLLADLLVSGKVIGWFKGRMEFGPRALGGRSIIGDARNSEMQTKMNLKIKYRESFRPFAPSVLAKDASEYFELDVESPYMLLVAPIRDERKISLSEADHELFGLEKLKVRRSDIPAVTHVDYSARIQTVDGTFNKAFYDLLTAFKEKTGSAVLINTSFNVRGEPIVCTPENAYNCFMNTEMDVLVLEDLILYKEEQPVNLELPKQQPDHVLD